LLRLLQDDPGLAQALRWMSLLSPPPPPLRLRFPLARAVRLPVSGP
jgi:hypothetical protein